MRITLFILILFISFFIFSIDGYSCSISHKPIDKFDKNKFVFRGEVIGYTKLYTKSRKRTSNLDNAKANTETDKIKKGKAKVNRIYNEWFDQPLEAIGLKVKPYEVINSPVDTESYFEVIPYRLDPTCISVGRFKVKENIKKDFPIGTNVFVTGFKSHYFPNSNTEKNIRIDNHFNNLLFSYESVEYSQNVHLGVEYQNLNPKNQLDMKIALFELEKDLKRLEHNYDEPRTSVLRRLIYFPFFHIIDYDALVQNYLVKGDINIKLFLKLRRDFITDKKGVSQKTSGK